MAELARMHAELVMKCVERSRPRAEMDYCQVGLPTFLDQNEESQPPQERMTKFEATMAELERVHTECARSKNQFMELTRTNVQIQPTLFKSVKEEIASMATSCTQLTFENEQLKQEESMRIQELVAKYMKEQENMAKMSFEGQHESLPSSLKVNKEEESLSYNEEITSRDNEELEKFQNVENDAQILETLVVNEEESTSSELHEKTNDEVLKTIPEMTFWVPMHEEVKNKKETPTSEVDEYIIHFNNELRRIIVKKKMKIK